MNKEEVQKTIEIIEDEFINSTTRMDNVRKSLNDMLKKNDINVEFNYNEYCVFYINAVKHFLSMDNVNHFKDIPCDLLSQKIVYDILEFCKLDTEKLDIQKLLRDL